LRSQTLSTPSKLSRVWKPAQSTHNLTRDVFINPEGAIELPADHVLKLLKTFYGLRNAGDHWSRTYHKNLMEDLNLETTVNDPALFFKDVDEKLEGLCATYVDDSLTAGSPGFLSQTTLTERKFELKPRKFDNVTYRCQYPLQRQTFPRGNERVH
jgi:hypothetical protein